MATAIRFFVFVTMQVIKKKNVLNIIHFLFSGKNGRNLKNVTSHVFRYLLDEVDLLPIN